MGIFASSDRPRRWTCLVQVCASTGKSRMALPTTHSPPDMMTGQSIRTCLRREVPTDHEAHSHTPRGQLRERVSYALSHRASAGLQPGGRSGNTMIQSRRVHDRGKPSRAKPDEEAQNAVCGTDLRGKDSNGEAFPATRKSGPHVARRNPRPCRRQGGQPSSGIINLHAQCLEGEESPRPRVARERACGGSARRSLWAGVWCAASLGKLCRST